MKWLLRRLAWSSSLVVPDSPLSPPNFYKTANISAEVYVLYFGTEIDVSTPSMPMADMLYSYLSLPVTNMLTRRPFTPHQ